MALFFVVIVVLCVYVVIFIFTQTISLGKSLLTFFVSIAATFAFVVYAFSKFV